VKSKLKREITSLYHKEREERKKKSFERHITCYGLSPVGGEPLVTEKGKGKKKKGEDHLTTCGEKTDITWLLYSWFKQYLAEKKRGGRREGTSKREIFLRRSKGYISLIKSY